jgi:hypothetical protein
MPRTHTHKAPAVFVFATAPPTSRQGHVPVLLPPWCRHCTRLRTHAHTHAHPHHRHPVPAGCRCRLGLRPLAGGGARGHRARDQHARAACVHPRAASVAACGQDGHAAGGELAVRACVRARACVCWSLHCCTLQRHLVPALARAPTTQPRTHTPPCTRTRARAGRWRPSWPGLCSCRRRWSRSSWCLARARCGWTSWPWTGSYSRPTTQVRVVRALACKGVGLEACAAALSVRCARSSRTPAERQCLHVSTRHTCNRHPGACGAGGGRRRALRPAGHAGDRCALLPAAAARAAAVPDAAVAGRGRRTRRRARPGSGGARAQQQGQHITQPLPEGR